MLKSVRVWIEKQSEKFNMPCDMTGMCAMASAELFTRMSKLGVNCKIAVNDCHVFVFCGDTVFDVTASQFGKDDVEIGKIGSEYFWEVHNEFNSVNELESHVLKEKWDIPVI